MVQGCITADERAASFGVAGSFGVFLASLAGLRRRIGHLLGCVLALLLVSPTARALE